MRTGLSLSLTDNSHLAIGRLAIGRFAIRRWSSYRLALAIFVVAMIGLVSSQTCCAQYRELPITPSQDSKVRSAKSIKDGVLRNKIPMDQKGTAMLAYYKRYLFPAMTRVDQRHKLASLRNEVIADLSKAKNPAARDAAYATILKTTKALVKSKQFHPATRYNALLLLGQLNKTEAAGSPPVPEMQSMGSLVRYLDVKTEPQILRYAAVMGLVRHAEISGHPGSPSAFNTKVRTVLAQKLLPVATETEVPEGTEAAAHAWLRSRAVEALGHLRFKGDPDVGKVLSDLVVDESADMNLRCTAAEALGRMAKTLDPSESEDLIGRVVKLIVDSSNAESLVLYEILNPTGSRTGARREGGGGGRRGGTRRREAGGLPDLGGGNRRVTITEEDIVDPTTTPTRRRYIFQLLTIKRALEGESRRGVDGLVAMNGESVANIIAVLDQLLEDLQDVSTNAQDLGGKLLVARKALVPLLPADLETEEDEALDAAIEAAAEAEPAADPAPVPGDDATGEANEVEEGGAGEGGAGEGAAAEDAAEIP